MAATINPKRPGEHQDSMALFIITECHPVINMPLLMNEPQKVKHGIRFVAFLVSNIHCYETRIFNNPFPAFAWANQIAFRFSLPFYKRRFTPCRFVVPFSGVSGGVDRWVPVYLKITTRQSCNSNAQYATGAAVMPVMLIFLSISNTPKYQFSMKKLPLLIMLCAACTFAKTQGFLNVGAGVNNLQSTVISLSVGYQVTHVVSEVEMKAPPLSTRVDNPAAFSIKSGFEFVVGGRVAFLPQIQASYLQYSTDEAKGATWQNGWKAGVGARVRWGHLFMQADYTGTTSMTVGICAQFKKLQSW